MITQAIVTALAAAASFVLGLLPVVPVPGWLTTTVPDAVAVVASKITSVSAWAPFDHVPTVLGFVAASIGLAVAVRGVRIGASFITGGGGSAA